VYKKKYFIYLLVKKKTIYFVLGGEKKTKQGGGGGGGGGGVAEGYVRCGGRVEAEAARARENETGPRHAARGWPAGRAGAGRAELVLLALLS